MIDEEYIIANDIYFNSTGEFAEVNIIASNSNNFDEIKPKWYYSNHAGATERWFQYKSTQGTYLLIEPDPPLMGEWIKIDPKSLPLPL
jgi:hypothetical protein